ncbi:MAG: NAD(P)H-binding protein [Planctomycetes bacterium]|nr:NAD(P)H-binding protein [Planctomycetota bacterium]
MANSEIHIVTGAFGYSGRYIAERLLAKGCRVKTLTNSQHRRPASVDNIEAFPFNFDAPEKLAATLQGADVLYNTYWVRFNHKDFKHSEAVDNTLKLFDCAKKAGVKRIVHVSITNPSLNSPFEYFRGKAQLEKALIESGISYAILRPAVLFGKEDILINNIAWMLRKFPVFGTFGMGNYKLQPIYVDDLAQLAIEQGEKKENVIIDAIGPETFTYRGLTKEIGKAIGVERLIIPIPDTIGYIFSWMLGKITGDVVVTWPEIKGLKAGLLSTDSPPAGTTKLTAWARENASNLGMRYANELARRKKG